MVDQHNLNSISYNNWNIYNASFNSISMPCPSNASLSSSLSSSLLASKSTDYYNYYNINLPFDDSSNRNDRDMILLQFKKSSW